MTNLERNAVAMGFKYAVTFEGVPTLFVKSPADVGPLSREMYPNLAFVVRPIEELEVVKRGDYWYVQFAESDRYYHTSYQEKWSADATKLGLESIWEDNADGREHDLRYYFVTGADKCRLCQVERSYIDLYGSHDGTIKGKYFSEGND